MELILPKTDVMLSSCSEVLKISSSLKKFGIIGFCYSRLYDDNSMIDICDSSDFIECIYYSKDKLYQYTSPDICPEMLRGEYTLFPCYNSDNPALQAVYNIFKGNYALIITKRQATYYETFYFCGEQEKRFINFCLNHLNTLEAFIKYFRNKAVKLIHNYEVDKIYRSIDVTLKSYNNELLQQYKQPNDAPDFKFTSSQNCSRQDSRVYLSDNSGIYLTHREMTCLNFCIKGKTAEEIALILQISNRTAQEHLNNVKQKLNCYKQTALVHKAIKLGLFHDDEL